MKMTSILMRVGLGLALAAGSACAKRVESSSGSSTDSLAAYYPLAVGNRWTYRVNGREDKQVEVSILSEEDGYFRDNQGGELAVDAYGLRDRKRYLLREPLEPGKEWTNVVSVSSTERYVLVGVGMPCESPAGSFQGCVKVEGRNRVNASTTLINTLTFAPGVGLVRIETMAESGGRQIPQTWLELVAWQVKPAAR